MDLKNMKIGFALTGSFCTIAEALVSMRALVAAGAVVYPIISYAVDQFDTRFYNANDLKEELIAITNNQIISTIPGAEPIGPRALLDVLVVSPCTGNTLAKIANAITDTPVTMAVKAHLRNERPVVLAVSTNDGLAANGKNIGALLNGKNIYFVPFLQDDPRAKTKSLVARNDLTVDTILHALGGKQMQPIILGLAQ